MCKLLFICYEQEMTNMLLRASCLTLEINEFGCYEVKLEESEKKLAATGSRTQATSGLGLGYTARVDVRPAVVAQ